MAIGKSITIESYGLDDSFWVIQTEWGRELRNYFCTKKEEAERVKAMWEIDFP
jgi:hypothetical protein